MRRTILRGALLGHSGSWQRILCYATLLVIGIGWGLGWGAGGAPFMAHVGGQEEEAATQVAIVPIHGEINRSQVILVRRAIEEVREQNADYLIVEIDTFGGRVDSALQITTLIGSLTDVETIAFVPVTSEGTGVSWSAGALISLACDAIFMSPGTSIGAATPVVAQADGTASPTDEKTVSAVRTQMAALAEKNGYPLGVALAMVDQDVELSEVYRHNTLLGAYTETEYEMLRNENPVGLKKGSVVSPTGKLLTLTAGQMETYNVSSGSPNSYEELYALLEAAPPIAQLRVENDNFDSFVAFLTSGAVISLLIVAGLIGLFIELTSPGFGFPGVLGILAFSIVFGANYLLGRVESLELLLLLCGVVLIILEIFLIPGFGVTGISGIVLIAISLILAQQNFTIPQFRWQWQILGENVLYVGAALVVGMIAFLALTPVASKGFLFKRLALLDAEDTGKGYTVQTEERRATLMHKIGTTLSVLRPTGRAKFDEEIITVESEGEFIEKGEKVRIVRVDSNRILVRKYEE